MANSAHPQADLKRADACLRRGDVAEAERIMLALRSRLPTDPFVAYHFGCVRAAQGRVEEAAQAWRQALAGKPDWVHPVVALANAASALGQRHDCLRYSEMALRLAPREAQVRLNHAIALHRLGRDAETLAAVAPIISADPRSVPAHILRMDVLRRTRRWSEAETQAKLLLTLVPQAVEANALLAHIFRLHAAYSDAEPVDRQLLAAAVAEKPDISPFAIARLTDDPAILASCAGAGGAARLAPPPAMPARPAEGRPLTVAYLSPDLGNHPVGHMLADVLAAHDRGRVRVVTASLMSDSGSEAARLRQAADVHLDLADCDAAEAVQRIRKAEVDVLVDLAGCSENSRSTILARRAAPVQVLWLGCPVSTGAHWYDAWLVDDVVAPAGFEAFTSEPLRRLPLCFHPIASGGGLGADPAVTRAALGLPDSVPVLAALHHPIKLNAEMVDAWIRIAASHPRAVLWMGISAKQGQENLRQRAARGGLEPNRLVFADHEPSRPRYLARWPLADLVLDCFPYGGHSTVGEALAGGCPVITRIGRSIPSRIAASMLRQVGLNDLIADDLPAYEALACALLADPTRLARLRERCAGVAEAIAAERDRGLTRALEDAYLALHLRAI